MSTQGTRENAMLKNRHPAYWIVFLVVIGLTPLAVFADTCDVPSGYPTIQAAVDDFNCTEIFVAAGRFYGDVTIPRTLLIEGLGCTSTIVLGKVMVEGSGTTATLN